MAPLPPNAGFSLTISGHCVDWPECPLLTKADITQSGHHHASINPVVVEKRFLRDLRRRIAGQETRDMT